MLKNKKTKIAIIGCGAIGEGIALFIEKKLSSYATLIGLSDISPEALSSLKRKIKSNLKTFTIDQALSSADLIIETASAKAAGSIIKKNIKYKKDLMILSVGAILSNLSLINRLKEKKANIYIPSGAICGVDVLGALSKGNIKKISLTTSKPPQGFKGADYFKKQKLNLDRLKAQTYLFKGSVKEAVRFFPKNINVAATLLLASSFKDIQVLIKADPKLKRNVHKIQIDAKEAKVAIEVENVPSQKNPKTSALTILSAQYLLEKIFSPFKIGS